MKTYIAKAQEVEHDWYHVDAEGRILGRLAVVIAMKLMGKDKPIYTPHVDTGDYVVVTNAEKVKLTGKKMEQKTYERFSGYPGGLKSVPIAKMIEYRPAVIIEQAVKRMLPKNRLGTAMFKKLKVYAGPDHPHAAQSPKPFEIK